MNKMKRHPARETAIIGRDIIICGRTVEPSAEPVSLRSRHAPGFGLVTLKRNGKPAKCCAKWHEHSIGADDFFSEPTLMHYENRARKNPNARWTLHVDGPMSGYVLGRKRGRWFVIESLAGFA